MPESPSLNITRDVHDGGVFEARNEFTRVVPDEGRIGVFGLLPNRDKRLFRYDRDLGKKGADYKGSSSIANRMDVDDAGEMLDMIHKVLKVHKEPETFLASFDHQMFLCYTLNGGSQFLPSNRVRFNVGRPVNGVYAHSYLFATVHQMLGVDYRRFFRAFANQVIEACTKVIFSCDWEDADEIEQRRVLILMAQERGISRYPHLVADCLDAATSVDPNQYHSVLSSKSQVLANSNNAVDKRLSVFPMRTIDNYDSSIGESVPVMNGGRAAPHYHE